MGITNNIDVNRADLSSQQARIAMQQTKLSMLPNVNASANYGINSGRTNDPITNADNFQLQIIDVTGRPDWKRPRFRLQIRSIPNL